MRADGLKPDLVAACAMVDALLYKWCRDERRRNDELLLRAQVGCAVCGCVGGWADLGPFLVRAGAAGGKGKARGAEAQGMRVGGGLQCGVALARGSGGWAWLRLSC